MVTVENQIEDVLAAIRPALHLDGGDVEFLNFHAEDGLVEVRLLGACESCPISMRTLKDGIEKRLRATLPEVRRVDAI